MTPSEPWYMNAVFYELYVRAYRDSNGDGKGDLRGVIEKLDYLQELGVDCLWLLPIYPSPLTDDGYDIADFTGVHADFGDVEDFRALLEEAHKRGLRVITDLVVNHTSDQHPWFIESRSSLDNPKRDWYVWSETDTLYKDARIIFVDTEPSNWAYDPQTGQYYWHRFFSSQPDLNYRNPEVQQAMLDVMGYWLEMGIDGFRVDAVPYLFEEDGTNSENLPPTYEYLRHMRAVLQERRPEAMMLCEANQPPGEVAAYLGDGDIFHMAFHFPLMPRIFMALRAGQGHKVHEIMASTPPIPDGCQWAIFLRNHDELTLEMVSEEERHWMWEQYAPDPRMRINLGIRRRLAPLLDNNPDKILLAHRLLFSLPGAVILYYGDEIGMGDNIWLEDRNGVRTPMQWDDSPNGGFSAAPAGELYAPPIDDEVFGYQRVNVARQREDPDSLLSKIKALIALRKAHPALASSPIEFLDAGHDALLAFLRGEGAARYVIVHNLSAQPRAARLDLAALAGCTVCDLLDPAHEYGAISGEPYRVELAPYQSAWLLVEEIGAQA